MLFRSQSCQDTVAAESGTTMMPSSRSDASAYNLQKDIEEIELKRSNSVLLLATSKGCKAVRGKFTGYMADEFRSTDRDRDIIEMFERAKTKVMNDSQCQKVRQIPECKYQLAKKLVLPAIL